MILLSSPDTSRTSHSNATMSWEKITDYFRRSMFGPPTSASGAAGALGAMGATGAAGVVSAAGTSVAASAAGAVDATGAAGVTDADVTSGAVGSGAARVSGRRTAATRLFAGRDAIGAGIATTRPAQDAFVTRGTFASATAEDDEDDAEEDVAADSIGARARPSSRSGSPMLGSITRECLVCGTFFEPATSGLRNEGGGVCSEACEARYVPPARLPLQPETVGSTRSEVVDDPVAAAAHTQRTKSAARAILKTMARHPSQTMAVAMRVGDEVRVLTGETSSRAATFALPAESLPGDSRRSFYMLASTAALLRESSLDPSVLSFALLGLRQTRLEAAAARAQEVPAGSTDFLSCAALTAPAAQSLKSSKLALLRLRGAVLSLSQQSADFLHDLGIKRRRVLSAYDIDVLNAADKLLVVFDAKKVACSASSTTLGVTGPPSQADVASRLAALRLEISSAITSVNVELTDLSKRLKVPLRLRSRRVASSLRDSAAVVSAADAPLLSVGIATKRERSASEAASCVPPARRSRVADVDAERGASGIAAAENVRAADAPSALRGGGDEAVGAAPARPECMRSLLPTSPVSRGGSALVSGAPGEGTVSRARRARSVGASARVPPPTRGQVAFAATAATAIMNLSACGGGSSGVSGGGGGRLDVSAVGARARAAPSFATLGTLSVSGSTALSVAAAPVASGTPSASGSTTPVAISGPVGAAAAEPDDALIDIIKDLDGLEADYAELTSARALRHGGSRGIATADTGSGGGGGGGGGGSSGGGVGGGGSIVGIGAGGGGSSVVFLGPKLVDPHEGYFFGAPVPVPVKGRPRALTPQTILFDGTRKLLVVRSGDHVKTAIDQFDLCTFRDTWIRKIVFTGPRESPTGIDIHVIKWPDNEPRESTAFRHCFENVAYEASPMAFLDLPILPGVADVHARTWTANNQVIYHVGKSVEASHYIKEYRRVIPAFGRAEERSRALRWCLPGPNVEDPAARPLTQKIPFDVLRAATLVVERFYLEQLKSKLDPRLCKLRLDWLVAQHVPTPSDFYVSDDISFSAAALGVPAHRRPDHVVYDTTWGHLKPLAEMWTGYGFHGDIVLPTLSLGTPASACSVGGGAARGAAGGTTGGAAGGVAGGAAGGAAGGVAGGAAGGSAGGAAGGAAGSLERAAIVAIYDGVPILNGPRNDKSDNACWNNDLAHWMNTSILWSELCDLNPKNYSARFGALVEALFCTRASARAIVSATTSRANADGVIRALHTFTQFVHPLSGVDKRAPVGPLRRPPSGRQHPLDEILQFVTNAIDAEISVHADDDAGRALIRLRDRLSFLCEEQCTYVVEHARSCRQRGGARRSATVVRQAIVVALAESVATSIAGVVDEALSYISRGHCASCQVDTIVRTTYTVRSVPDEVTVYVPDTDGVAISQDILFRGRRYVLDVIANREGGVARTHLQQNGGHYTFCRVGAPAPDGSQRAVLCDDGATFELCDYTNPALRSGGLFRFRLVPSAGAGSS